jgi:hypothetical protein
MVQFNGQEPNMNMDMMDTVIEIALMAMDNDAMREQIQDDLDLTDEELIEIYKYIGEKV